jgi:pilus assembly protein Flp/PilA
MGREFRAGSPADAGASINDSRSPGIVLFEGPARHWTPTPEPKSRNRSDRRLKRRSPERSYPMTKFMSRFAKDESGATAIEYGLIVALIAVVIITAVTTLGTKLNTAFTTINSKLT